MGRGTVYKIREHDYRPEEVAARLIRHARGLVESFLAAQVRDRVIELARSELGVVRDEWLGPEHDLRIPRPQVIVTIPAYFTNNQKAATRSACRIAEVTLVRLVHEPTAACITAARERRLTDAIAVVDLGAGTLDISLVDVGDNVYEAQQVSGDAQFGGKDLDAAVTKALVARLGIDVPARGAMRRRLEIAAESLKIDLSAQEHATYELRGVGDANLHLELSRTELASILADQLAKLHQVCADFRAAARTPPKHLVLIGRPMLSPLIRETVEAAFGMTRTVVSDPRTAVASGAALLAAMRAGSLDDVLLIDVTPLSLGIRTHDEHDQEHLSELVARNTTIPMKQSKIFSTHSDRQTVVRVEIFNGALDRQSKIGQFLLTGIPPAEAGVPQIEVTFEIDSDCVLAVTARDQGTGQSNSIRIADTTLLSPAEIADLTRRYDRQRATEQRQLGAATARERLRSAAEATMDDDSAAGWQEFRHRRDTHRTAHGPQDAATQRLLVEIFSESGRIELELERARDAVRTSALAALDHVERPHSDLAADLSATNRLTDDLAARAAELRELVTKVARWNALLVREALNEPDPLQRFRNHYAAGDHRQALAAHPEPPDSPTDLSRYAHCLAETGDHEAYRALRRTAPPPTLAQVRGASGFLVHPRLVVIAGPGDVNSVELNGVSRPVTVVRTDGVLTVLELAEPAETAPAQLGYAALVTIGDPIRTAGAVGLIERFEATSFATSLRLPPDAVGQPVCDDLGEVIGVVTAITADGAHVVPIDTVDPLLRAAGFDRHA
nr:Hsp70 family protein [Kribbella sandramycini]